MVGFVGAADEEFAAERDVDAHIAMHCMLTQQIDTEFLARFSEAPLAVESEDVGEDSAAFVVVNEVKEFEGEVFGGRWEGTVFGRAVVVIDTIVLVMQGVVEDATAEGGRGEHAFDEGFEFDVAVIEAGWDGAGELDLVGLKAVGKVMLAISGRLCQMERGIRVSLRFAIFARLFRASETANHGTKMLRPMAWTNRPHAPTIISVCLTQHLDAKNDIPGHMNAPRKHSCAASNQVGALTTHAFLNFVCLFSDRLEVLAEAVDFDMDVSQAIIMICRVFVVDACFEVEATGRDVGDDPIFIPNRIAIPSNCSRSKTHGRILFMSCW